MSKKSSKKHAKEAVRPEIPDLFKPISLRGVTARNRIWLPPMDMYSAFNFDGRPNDFHYQHYISRANGGFGLIIVESTAVAPEGRISPCDLGLWADDQIDSFRWIADGLAKAGAVPAIQLNHAGRKGSTGCFKIGHMNESVPLENGGWETLGPSEIPFGNLRAPKALTVEEIHAIEDNFRDSAWRAMTAGFNVIEIHAAHGYLISEFLDPLVNTRDDQYGGSLENRARFLVEIVDKVRGVIRDDMPLLVRISATDWAEGGWDADQSVELAKVLREHGVDLVDVSTGGIIDGVTIPVEPGYQVRFAEEIREKAEVPTTAVGLITKPKQAEKILEKGQADAVEIGRAALREPSWPLCAGYKLGLGPESLPYPKQYIRGAYPAK